MPGCAPDGDCAMVRILSSGPPGSARLPDTPSGYRKVRSRRRIVARQPHDLARFSGCRDLVVQFTQNPHGALDQFDVARELTLAVIQIVFEAYADDLSAEQQRVDASRQLRRPDATHTEDTVRGQQVDHELQRLR